MSVPSRILITTSLTFGLLGIEAPESHAAARSVRSSWAKTHRLKETPNRRASTHTATSSDISPNAPRIIGGNDALEGQYPWMASILDSGEVDPKRAVFCGATLIDAQWLVTAAHCVEQTDPEDIKIAVGHLKLNNITEDARLEVAGIFVHPNYAWDDDIALIHLAAPTDAEPITGLVTSENAHQYSVGGSPATVIGFGVTTRWGFSPASTLQEADLTIFSDEQCRETTQLEHPLGLSYGEHMMCAGVPSGTKDSCYGDSGGPLFVRNYSGQALLAGIVSWGYECALSDRPGFYTELQDYSGNDDWIEQCMSDPEECPRRVVEPMFQCDDGEYLPSDWVCDGGPDCLDGEDEIDCVPFSCDDGEIIPQAWECDGDDDCEDGTDEHDECSFPVACDDGETIEEAQLCDGTPNCADGEDEEYCTPFECNDGEEIPELWRCDYEQDCEDGEDEVGCDINPVVCSDGTTLPPIVACDYWPDCEDGEDEVGCNFPMTTCDDGTPILEAFICDYFLDCDGGEDEANCQDGWRCDDGEPIPSAWYCDGEEDCDDGEDEADCDAKNLTITNRVNYIEECGTGGETTVLGTDYDYDGELSPWEILSTQHLCDDTNGDGKNAAIRQTEETPGLNCTEGGTRIDTGVDMNDNGSLDDEEIEDTSYVCNGESAKLPIGCNIHASNSKSSTGLLALAMSLFGISALFRRRKSQLV